LAESVKVIGWKSGEEVRQEILAARAMVLPSFAEGLPVVIMETLALGRPVISTYIAGRRGCGWCCLRRQIPMWSGRRCLKKPTICMAELSTG
jgi:hypothetical protein